jgi:hypothetical protein
VVSITLLLPLLLLLEVTAAPDSRSLQSAIARVFSQPARCCAASITGNRKLPWGRVTSLGTTCGMQGAGGRDKRRLSAARLNDLRRDLLSCYNGLLAHALWGRVTSLGTSNEGTDKQVSVSNRRDPSSKAVRHLHRDMLHCRKTVL